MKDEYIQYKAAEDDRVYLYNVDIKKWQKLCDIETPAHLPLSVIKQVRDDKKKAQSLPVYDA
jgi:hypothetical protein